jgi:cell division protein FtsI (penicillin-binding protein 3)
MVRLSRIGLIHFALALFAVALLVRAGQVQLWEGRAWAARAARQHATAADVPAPRGQIRDASGNLLAESRELVQLSVAPKEVRDQSRLRRALLHAGVPVPWVSRALDRRRAWVTLPGRYLPTDAASATALRGVYGQAVSERVYAVSEGLRPVVGRVGEQGAVDGIELALDSLLTGSVGKQTVLRDARGRRFESPTAPGVAPRPGHSVTLTLNRELQEICERALADAVQGMSADGGDIVVLDPHGGEILALASRRAGGRVSASTALTEPFEPGSTLKPFIAAALLGRGRAKPQEVIETYDGTYTIEGRTITDIHKAPRLSLADVILFSSNIGIVRFAERLTPREEFETLRDLGFGTPTGVLHPSEASGTLREPRSWSKQSPASLAMGYEIAVTPLQLATAYASIANGGELIAPALVKEIRDPDGAVRFRHQPRVVRRVMSPEVASSVRQMLAGVVERGTAEAADLTTFAVAGKSGTARRVELGRGYVAGEYTATFVGLFPADEPQYVILVKLDNPAGKYYGGQTAAPVTKVVLQAALAARDAALDRGALAGRQIRVAAESAAASIAPEAAPAERAGTVPYVVDLGARAPTRAPQRSARPVPDVRGMPLRKAVRALHDAGFRVQLVGGEAGAVVPSVGTLVAPGSLVKLSAP